jgi:hypothetical protein
MRNLGIRVAGTAAAAGAAIAARKAVESGWRLYRGEEPPSPNPFDEDTDLLDFVLWTAVVAGTVWAARRLAVKGTERLLAAAD